jgi:peptidyl-prolyl cis-trans isomerase D
LLLNQTVDFFKNTYFSSSSFDNQFAKLLSRERKVSTYTINPQDFYAKINISESQINNYYKQNISKFTQPDKVRIQFIQLSTEQLTNSIKPTDAEINKYINGHKTQLPSVQINASHILFNVPAGTPDKDRATIRARAKKVLLDAKAHPGKFANLARKYSEDPGSAGKGGSLGLFGKGVMVKPFEEAAFNMKPGQISDLVETQFGYHIIKLNKLKDADDKQVKDAAILAIKKQKATAQLPKQLEQLNDITYNQPTMLEPAAKKFGLTIQTHDWVEKGSIQGEFADPKIQKAIFSNDLIKNHNNSEVIDLGNGLHAVYRVTEYQAAKIQPLDLVKEQIINQLKQQQGTNLAATEGQKNIELLKQGKLNLRFANSQNITLLGQYENVDPLAIKQIFSTQLGSTPAYTGSINTKGGFVIYKINSEAIDLKLNEQNQKMLEQFNMNNSMLDFGAYISYLRSKYPVSYKTGQMDLSDLQQNNK